MGRVSSATKHPWSLLSPDPQPYFLISQPPPPPEQTNNAGGSDGLDHNISPGILLVIIIIAIIFFVCGLLHLLVRLLLYSPTSSAASRDPDDTDGVTALQGQLRQLFNLHDAGVDQTFIDALPVFHYNAIIGLKNPFDCAVCLCEFHAQDKLRLLPKCSHAFHMECIDTWLLSHSTCPLCRSSIIPDLAPDNTCAPVVFLLESGSESSREIVSDMSSNTLPARLSSNRFEAPQKYCEIPHIIDQIETPEAVVAVPEAKVVPVKLGKYRNVDGGREGSSSESADAGRRCFSMGSFEYVLDESSSLRVPIRTPANRKQIKKRTLPLVTGLQPAMSECDVESRREFDGFEACTSKELRCGDGGRSKESFSVSKTWLRAAADSSRRAFSFRFPVNRNVGAAGADSMEAQESGCRRTMSEVELGKREMSSNLGWDDVIGGRMSLDSEGHAPSFARRTLLWLVGRQNRVVHSTDPNL